MTAEGTACNGAGEAPKAEFPPEKAVAASPEEEAAAAASPEEKAAGEREGEDVGGPFVIVNGGDSDGHSDRGSDLDKAPSEDSPSEEEDVPGPNAAPDTAAAEDHGASAGKASAPSAALATSAADGVDRAADGSEGGADESKGEPSSDFVTVAAQQEAAGEEHGEAAATASSGSDPAVTSADSKAPALGSEVEAKEGTVDESVATDVAESVVHKAVNEEQDGEDAAAGSCEHDDALSSAKSSSAVKESEVIGEDSNEERSAADVAEPLGQGTGGAIALVENGHICANMSADSIKDATEPESQEDAAVESLGHDDAPMYAKPASAAMDSEVNGEDSREEQSAADIAEVVKGDVVEVVEGTDDVCALMANGHVCADITADSFEASTKPDSHAKESKLEQNVTEIAESVERDAVCEDGTDASQTNGHMVASESEFHAIDTEGQETDQQEEGALTSQADVSEGPPEAASIEEPIGEEVNAHGHSNAEGSSNKQVEGEAICGIIQLDKKLGNDSADSSYEESGVVSSNDGVEKAINEGVPDMCGLEEVTENTSQETVQGDGFIKDGVSICTDPSVKSNLEHNVRAEVATVDETAADDNVVEEETAARGVEEILVKDEADLTPFLSQQNCESSTETVEHEKIEAPGQANEIEAPSQANEIEAPSQSNEIEAPSQSNEIEAPSQSNEIEAPSQSNEIEAPSQSNEIENDVAEGEVKKEAAREVVDAVPLQEAATSAVSTFHNEPRSIDLVGSMIGHSSPVTELEPCDHVHTDVKQLVSVTSPEHGTVVDNEAEITSEKENGSQEKSSKAAVDQVEPVELKGELVEDDNAQAGGICKKDESSESENVGGSKSHKNQSEICNPSNMSNEGSNIIGDEVPSPIDEVDETCSVTCTETVNESIKSTNEVETKGLEALEPSSICTAVPAEDKGNDQHAPGGLHGDHAEVIGPHRVYLIKTPRFAGEDLWAKTQAAQAHLDKLTQERDAINRRKQKQKVVCDQFREKLEAARLEEREARAAHGDKKNDLNSVKSVIGKMHQANSIEGIDELIAMKERTVQHETISLPEEKNLIKEIKNLKAQRKALSSSMGSKAEINEAFSQKDDIHERHKELKKDSDVLFTNLKSLEENTRKILKSFENERIALRKLNEEYRAANELRQKAYSKWSELKAEPWKKNQCFFAYREDRRIAEGYKTSGDMHKLRSHCNDQIKRVMELWNENEDFRKQYVEANKFSTLRRLGTVDGRRLGPDEDPPVIPSNRPRNTSPLTASSPDIPTFTSVPAPELAAPASVPAKEDSFPVLPSPQISKPAKSKASGRSAQNENNAVTTLEAEDIKQTEKEKARLMEEQLELARKAEELARKEEELRKERAAAEKERLRLEQKAKAKEAEERKRRKAEKDKERAEFKARKEAEEKEKKKSKKDKKKGPAPAESSAVGDSNAAASATTDTDSNASDNPRDVEVPQSAAPKRLSRPAAAIKQLNRVQPMPAPLRNRGKRRMRQYILIASAVLSVLALFVAGNYIPRMKSLHY